MNSIERVRAAVHFNSPDRVPIFKMGLGTDVFSLAMLPPKSWQPGNSNEEIGVFPYLGDEIIQKLHLWTWKKPEWSKSEKYRNWTKQYREEIDEWGCYWIRDAGYKTLGHPSRPALPDWSKLTHYLDQYPPNVENKDRYKLFLLLKKFLGRRFYRMAMFMNMGPFQTAMNIRRFNNYLLDFRRHPQELKVLLESLTQCFIKNEKSWVKYGGEPHGFFMYDDLGSQDRPFLQPAVFEKFFSPVYKPIIDTAHEQGCDFFLHSCGKIDPLIPIFQKWGIDGFEFDSPHMCGYDSLAEFRGKLMFWACVDIQKIYATGTPDHMMEEVKLMVKNLGTENGGFGAYFYPQSYHIKVPQSNIKAFEDGLKRYGIYSK